MDEQLGIPANDGSYQVVQLIVLKNKIGRRAFDAQVVQDHFHAAFNFKKFRFEFRIDVAGIVLQKQAHGRDGCLDLVGPESIIILQSSPFLFRIGLKKRLFRKEDVQQF